MEPPHPYAPKNELNCLSDVCHVFPFSKTKIKKELDILQIQAIRPLNLLFRGRSAFISEGGVMI